MVSSRPLIVGLDVSLVPWAPEIKYVLRSLLRVAGYPYEFIWVEEIDRGPALDLYYGPRSEQVRAAVRIAANGRRFTDASQLEPRRFLECDGVGFLDFSDQVGEAYRSDGDGLTFSNDIVFAAYWLLTGAREPYYQRDRWDNLNLEGSFFLDHLLAAKPLVSLYGALLREYFERRGHLPLRAPWTSSHADAAFVFSHDVDYPEMIRWIECLRLVGTRGLGCWRTIGDVLRGSCHFWKFSDWVDFEKSLGTRPAFYFAARSGSLLQYARGRPDVFYDIRATQFAQLFRYLRDEGCEIGLHASYSAYRHTDDLRREKQLLEDSAEVRVEGTRHHFWHLDPAAPHATLAKHEEAGFTYDSSLAFEFYPGFRRGICHPFRPFHPGERRELRVVQLPPAWMDDHFVRRRSHNQIAEPVDYARHLLEGARTTNGVLLVDYHVRGMNDQLYPGYGPWLMEFVRDHLSSAVFCTPGELVRLYGEYEKRLDADSIDRAAPVDVAASAAAPPRAEIGPMCADDVPAVAQLHFDLFNDRDAHGHSVATLGRDFLAQAVYRLNLDNPYFFCDVARYQDSVVGFSVYTTDRHRVSRYSRRHFWRIVPAVGRLIVKNPIVVATFISNVRYVRREQRPWLQQVHGWWVVAGVRPECRTEWFERTTGVRIAEEMFHRMEQTMLRHSCRSWYGVVDPTNMPINLLLQRHGARMVGTARAQGMTMNYYVKTCQPGDEQKSAHDFGARSVAGQRSAAR